jgi:hypothetical protein
VIPSPRAGTDRDGGCYVTTFDGPMTEQRARAYFDALKSGGAAKQQAKLKEAIMLGLERELGPEYQLINGVLFNSGRRASFPGLSPPPLFADVTKAEAWLEANVSAAPSGPKTKRPAP